MTELGRFLIIIGLVTMLVGFWLLFGPKGVVPGKLPGDIHFEIGGAKVFIPITTSIIFSGLIALVSFLFKQFK